MWKILKRCGSDGAALFLGTLLNAMDSVTYGILLFPAHLNVPHLMDQRFRLAGITCYLLCTAASQVVISLMSSFPKGIATCMMVEHLPFLQRMATIIAQYYTSHNEDPSTGFISTLLFAYMLATLIISLLFLSLAVLRLDRTVHQLPRAVLVGALGGIGVFLLVTGFQVINVNNLSSLLKSSKILIWLVPLITSIAALIIERQFHPPFLGPISTLLIFVILYGLIYISGKHIKDWRKSGWLLDVHDVDFSQMDLLFTYRQFHWSQVNFDIIPKLLPVIIASAIFAILHVPINIPSFARTFGLGFQMHSELEAHAMSNLVTTIVGLQPNYMSYTSSILFRRAGATDRFTGCLMGLTTLLVAWYGLPLVPYVPTTAMLFIIFYLALDLMVEATISTKRICVDTIEYAIILVVMLSTLIFGFLGSLLFGMVLSFLHVLFKRILRGELREEIRETVSPSMECMLRGLQGHTLVIVPMVGHLYWGNSLNFLSKLRQFPPDCQILILDARALISIDLNIVEGALASLMTAKRKLWDVYIIHAMPKLAKLLSTELGVRVHDNLSQCLEAIFTDLSWCPQISRESEDTASLITATTTRISRRAMSVQTSSIEVILERTKDIRSIEQRLMHRGRGSIRTLPPNQPFADIVSNVIRPEIVTTKFLFVVLSGSLQTRWQGQLYRLYSPGSWIGLLQTSDEDEEQSVGSYNGYMEFDHLYSSPEEGATVLPVEVDIFDNEDVDKLRPYCHPA